MDRFDPANGAIWVSVDDLYLGNAALPPGKLQRVCIETINKKLTLPSAASVERLREANPGWDWIEGAGWQIVNAELANTAVHTKVTGLKCDCGVDSTYETKMPLEIHSDWCRLITLKR